MLKKTITYKDLDGDTHTEDFYFHLTQADVAKMELSHINGGSGGFAAYLQQIAKKESGKDIIEAFEGFIEKSYGSKSLDGKSFERDPEKTRRFMTSEAYSVLFIELVTDAQAGADFVNGIMPTDLKLSADKINGVISEVDKAPAELPQKSLDQMNDEELKAYLAGKHPKDMSVEELRAGMRLKMQSA